MLRIRHDPMCRLLDCAVPSQSSYCSNAKGAQPPFKEKHNHPSCGRGSIVGVVNLCLCSLSCHSLPDTVEVVHGFLKEASAWLTTRIKESVQFLPLHDSNHCLLVRPQDTLPQGFHSIGLDGLHTEIFDGGVLVSFQMVVFGSPRFFNGFLHGHSPAK